MDNLKITQFSLEVSAEDASAEEIDAMTRQLLRELRDLDLESVELVSGGAAPEGTKAVDPVTIGAITLAVLPNLLPKVVEFVQAWALRGQGRTVKFKGKIAGQTVQFEGPASDLQKLIATLSQPKNH
jgi:hypothetical protein